MKSDAERKKEERQRRRDAGEHLLQLWIPKDLRPAIEAAVAKILQEAAGAPPEHH